MNVVRALGAAHLSCAAHTASIADHARPGRAPPAAPDKPIPAGTEVLHTYGDLSDSQLLQTYGFLDSEDDFKAGSDQAEAAAAAVAKKRGRMTARQAAAAAAAAAAYRNPHNAALVPYSTVQQVCSGLLASMDQVKRWGREVWVCGCWTIHGVVGVCGSWWCVGEGFGRARVRCGCETGRAVWYTWELVTGGRLWLWARERARMWIMDEGVYGLLASWTSRAKSWGWGLRPHERQALPYAYG